MINVPFAKYFVAASYNGEILSNLSIIFLTIVEGINAPLSPFVNCVASSLYFLMIFANL